MSDGIWSALSGAVGQGAQLETAANNVANASTPGYQADRLVFREVLTRAGNRPNPQGKNLRYAAADNVMCDTAPGDVVQTGRALDVAIRGQGYLMVQAPSGVRFTRAGSLQVRPDGSLVTKSGYALLDANAKPIKVPANATDVSIRPDGSVIVAGASVGQLQIAKFTTPAALEKAEPLTLRPTQASGPPQKITPTLEPGALEGSNVSAVKGMVDIIGASRGFEACQRVIDAFRDADRRAAMALMGKE